tara:strand:- start:637 stop:1074 length:438 start_codon:yes stop_codon:yes gene_type:complete
MRKKYSRRALSTIAAAIVLFSITPASAENDLESRIQMLEQELKLLKEHALHQVRHDQELAATPKKKGFSTLPGWSAGYRYNLNADDKSATRIRLFLKRKSIVGNVIKLAWERRTGHIPNFFRTGTIDGNSLNKWGTIYLEQEFKF